jgi:hypothetical protein
MSLSIHDCAAQLDLYAQSHETKAAAHEARYHEHMTGSSVEERAICAYEAHHLGIATEAARQLRFAAAFLRENAVLRWTEELPTKEGAYWTRGGVGFPKWIAEVRHNGTKLVLTQPGSTQSLELAGLVGRQWAGPIADPEEPAP